MGERVYYGPHSCYLMEGCDILSTVAKRGSTKRASVEHEEHIAKLYNGIRSPSSGGADNDSGDVRAARDLIECKTTGQPGKVCKRHSVQDCPDCLRTKLIRDFEKVAEEAYAEGRSPVVALRFYVPDSILANPKGYIDFSVRLAEEDASIRDEIS
jgi:hypothetical protein